MAADLNEKTARYRRLLKEALDDAKKAPGMDPQLERIASEFYEMAKSYYLDGVHFLEAGDSVNALVCFSYGHAWLDAGVRIGAFKVTKKNLFAA
ncbi:DUF357 domain-containing protein [Methanocella conradii]|uniref:DUF357 domain-containing protein n=1 Tax=Methanocella conradii TaxID=1175444 RepID=UPI00157D78DA